MADQATPLAGRPGKLLGKAVEFMLSTLTPETNESFAEDLANLVKKKKLSSAHTKLNKKLQTLLDDGQIRSALELAELSRDALDFSDELVATHADLLLRTNDRYKEARTVLEGLFQSQPRHPLRRLFPCLVADSPAAPAILESFLAANEDCPYPFAYRTLAGSVRSTDAERALALLERAIQLDPDDQHSHIMMRDIHEEMGYALGVRVEESILRLLGTSGE